jgi:exosortase/archaeosortase family protein
VHGSELVLDVTRDSTGWKSMLAVTALIIAVGRPFRQTVQGVVTGVGVLFAANLLRITSMFYAVTVYDVSYELLHTVLWRWGLTAVVLVTWLWWLSERSLLVSVRRTGKLLVK